MDVPSWHPANQNSDAARRLAMSGEASAPKRVTYEVVDTSTEAEREMVATEEENVVLAAAADCWTRRIACTSWIRRNWSSRPGTGRKWSVWLVTLQTFRSNALKLQAHKTEITVAVSSNGRKSPLSVEKKAVVVIKAKKRLATPSGKETTKTKKSRTISRSPAAGGEEDQTPVKVQTQENSKKSGTTLTTKPPIKNPATALLLQDYSSSSDDE
ncbi:hypothetical protein GQ600_4845 [Phytophthora cactorum]|nr:hypothetical protein GQ600_4845 [Phytophthora cactorum]